MVLSNGCDDDIRAVVEGAPRLADPRAR